MSSLKTYLPAGLPTPVPENDGLDKPYWDAVRRGELRVQRCKSCGASALAPVPSIPRTLSTNEKRRLSFRIGRSRRMSALPRKWTSNDAGRDQGW